MTLTGRLRPATVGARRSATVSGPGATADEARREVFRRLTDARLLAAYRLATAMLRDPTEAQDAVHDAAVVAWTRFDELRDRDRFEAWFDRIVVNVCRQRLRRPVRVVPVDGIAEPGSPDESSDRADLEALREALERLTPDHRAVVMLRHLEGCSIAEISARVGERPGTVKSRLHYAIRELRAAYDAIERDTEGRR